MVLESKPTGWVTFPPADSKPYQVKTGDDWGIIAKREGMDVWDLIEFNFPVVRGAKSFNTKCKQVNWLLRNYVGCSKSKDHKNYSFDSSDSPGKIYLPKDPAVIPKGKCADWELTAKERRSVREAGGETFLRWAEKAPKDLVESREFKPAKHLRSDYKAILAWKSCDPKGATCRLHKARLQYIMLLHDDLDYWRDRTESEIAAKVKQAGQQGAVKAYRWRVITMKQCPFGARTSEVEEAKILIITMMGGLYGLIPSKIRVSIGSGFNIVPSVERIYGWFAQQAAKLSD